MSSNIPAKIKETILEHVKAYKQTSSDDKILIGELGVSSRTLKRYLDYLSDIDGTLSKQKEGKKHIYRLKDKELLAVSMSQKDATTFDCAIEFSRSEFDEDTISLIKNMFHANTQKLIGHLGIMEDFKDTHMKSIFEALSRAIEERKYLKFELMHDKFGRYDEVKPIKMLFIENNWYIAFESKNPDSAKKYRKFRLARLSFIKEIRFLEESNYSDKNTFQAKEIAKYLPFLENIQNPMTLYGKIPQTATIKATPNIARYFDDGMKKFLSSQKFQEKLDDGSVIFTLQYTQPLEILPLIRRWLPHLIIIEPQSLKDAYIKELKESLKNYEI